jgi:hypothetical protein
VLILSFELCSAGGGGGTPVDAEGSITTSFLAVTSSLLLLFPIGFPLIPPQLWLTWPLLGREMMMQLGLKKKRQ